MSVVLNREQVRSEFEKRYEVDEDGDETRSTSISISELLGIFNNATEGGGFEESDITGAYLARGWTEDTALTWADIDGFMNAVVPASVTRNEISPTLPMSSVAEDTTKTEIYNRITVRQKGNVFPFVDPDELSDVDKKGRSFAYLNTTG